MHVQNLKNSLWDIRIFLGLIPKESHRITRWYTVHTISSYLRVIIAEILLWHQKCSGDVWSFVTVCVPLLVRFEPRVRATWSIYRIVGKIWHETVITDFDIWGSHTGDYLDLVFERLPWLRRYLLVSALGYKTETVSHPETWSAACEVAGGHNAETSSLQRKSFSALSFHWNLPFLFACCK